MGNSPFETLSPWTYIDDIVRGTILAAEKIDDGTAVNLGTMERTRVLDTAAQIVRYMGHEPETALRPEFPTGPYNRVADNSPAKRLPGWEPKINFHDGLRRTIDWYTSAKNPGAVWSTLARIVIER